jgi:hypothetical protein
MNYMITENQLGSLIMEFNQSPEQKVSNYLTRAVRIKFPVVDEVEVQFVFTPSEILKNQKRKDIVKVFIYVNQQLNPVERNSDKVSETQIQQYTQKIIEKFFGLTVLFTSFDSTKFEYIDGNY